MPEVGVLQWLPALNEYQAVQVVGRIYLALPIRGVGVSACPFERSLQSPSRSESQPSRKGCFEPWYSNLSYEPLLVCDGLAVFQLSVLQTGMCPNRLCRSVEIRRRFDLAAGGGAHGETGHDCGRNMTEAPPSQLECGGLFICLHRGLEIVFPAFEVSEIRQEQRKDVVATWTTQVEPLLNTMPRSNKVALLHVGTGQVVHH